MIKNKASTLPSLYTLCDPAPDSASRIRSQVEGFSFAETPRLVAALRAGDEDAFRWLYRNWNQRLFRYCFVLARGDGALAGEFTQAVYLRIFRHLRPLPDEPALWNWVARAARSAAADHYRTGGRYRGALARFATWLSLRENGSHPESVPDHEALLVAALHRAMARLEDADRRIIEGRYFERRPLAEIGHRLGITERAVEGRLARLRRRLRQHIETELRSDPASE